MLKQIFETCTNPKTNKCVTLQQQKSLVALSRLNRQIFTLNLLTMVDAEEDQCLLSLHHPLPPHPPQCCQRLRASDEVRRFSVSLQTAEESRSGSDVHHPEASEVQPGVSGAR